MLIRFLFFVFTFVLLPRIAFGVETEVGDVRDFGEYISETWAWASQVIFGVSVVMIVIGGMVLMFAGSDERTIDSAKTIIQGAIISSLLVTFSAVLLKVLHKPTAGLEGTARLSDTSTAIRGVTMILFGIIGGIAVLALIYSSYMLISSHGDVDKAEKGKRGIKFAIMGLIIALAAFVVQSAVIAPFSDY